MEIPDYPPNKNFAGSAKYQAHLDEQAKKAKQGEKNIKRVTTEEPKRKKKSRTKRFVENFVIGDAKSATDYAVFDVMLPLVRDGLTEITQQFFENLFRGDSRHRRGSTPPPSGPSGVVSYNRYFMGSRPTGPQRTMSRRARASHDFDDIVLQTRSEADNVIDGMYEIVSQYGVCSIADLYGLVGITSTHTDEKWGWIQLSGSGITKIREGYLLDLPQPVPLD